ncbi:hypothetical protein FOA52_015508 [Chlamydomonas sp. UWO 241]|nr:hypothetical protein FOA52_015508 [Chlamydomonas sp. UWO 241]
MHHKLRRDPNWHPNGCNICGQIGHQAAQCTSGTVNWRQIYGESTFKLKPPQYWSEELARIQAKHLDAADLEKQAKEFAKATAEREGLDFEAILRHGEEMNSKAPEDVIEKAPVAADEEPLPPGWAQTADPNTGKPYFWHKKTQKVAWERPTADTPIQ